MGHHAQYIAPRAADAGDILQRTVGVSARCDLAFRRRIAKYNAVVALEFCKYGVITEVVAFHVADGDGKDLTLPARIGEGCVRAFDSDIDWLLTEFQTNIVEKNSGY